MGRTALAFVAMVAWFVGLDQASARVAFWATTSLGVSSVTAAAIAAFCALVPTLVVFAGLVRANIVGEANRVRGTTLLPVMLALLWGKLFAPQSESAALFSSESLPFLGFYLLSAMALIPLFRRLVPSRSGHQDVPDHRRSGETRPEIPRS